MLGIMGKSHSSPVVFRIDRSESCLFCIIYYVALFGIKLSVYETPPPSPPPHISGFLFSMCYLQFICHPDISLVFLNKLFTLYRIPG